MAAVEKQPPPFHVLIMSEESRLGRESIEVGYALKQLVVAGVHVWFYLEDRERTLNSPIEKAMLALQAMSDDMERERARQRTYDALQRKARLGQVCGGRTFGYDNIDVVGPGGQRSHVERRINPREATTVRRLFELATRSCGVRTIAKTLNAERHVAPRPQQGRPHRCALCGGGLFVRSGKHGNRRERYYGCSSNHQRGHTVCENTTLDVMRALDDAVISAFERQLLGRDMVDDVLKVALAQLAPAKVHLLSDRGALERTKAGLDVEVERLTAAIAAGGTLASLVAALKDREQERDRVRRQLASAEVAERRADATPRQLREALAKRFDDWRGMLRRQPQLARQVVKKLVAGPIRCTPRRDAQGRGYYDFECESSLVKLLGTELPISVASPMPASWNQISTWLRTVDELREAA